MRSVFLDTAFAIALVSQQDMYHERAGTLLEEIERERTSVVTTQAIREIGYDNSDPFAFALVATVEEIKQGSFRTLQAITDQLNAKSVPERLERLTSSES